MAADLPVTLDGNRSEVVGWVDGADTKLLLGTGAGATVLDGRATPALIDSDAGRSIVRTDAAIAAGATAAAIAADPVGVSHGSTAASSRCARIASAPSRSAPTNLPGR